MWRTVFFATRPVYLLYIYAAFLQPVDTMMNLNAIEIMLAAARPRQMPHEQNETPVTSGW